MNLKPEKMTANLPFVSVIMPVRNEEAYIERSLRAVLAQTYPPERFEIIIADGISTDDTREIIRQIQQTAKISIEIVENSGRIAPTGLNRAIERVKGEIIVRVDGHCEIEKDYIENCVRHLLADNAEAVGGSIETIGETYSAQAIALAMSSRFGVGNSAFRTVKNQRMYVDTVAFPGYKKEVLEKIGLFNEELVRNQDDEYNYRLRKSGGRVLLAPEIKSKYFSRSNLLSLWRQYYQYGFWKVRVCQLHPRQMSLRQFVPLIFVLTLAALIIWSLFSVVGVYLLAAVLAAYLLAALLASLAAVSARDYKYILLLPFCFPVLHLSFGFGFLAGLFYFRNRWKDGK
jgi:succinoglycan biosynthesis protein ExoA